MLHFDGHANPDGSLILENVYGEAQLLKPETLAQMTSEYGVELVVLGEQHPAECIKNLRSAGVPAALGVMSSAEQDSVAEFIGSLYAELARGRSLREAFSRSRSDRVAPVTDEILFFDAEEGKVLLTKPMTSETGFPSLHIYPCGPETLLPSGLIEPPTMLKRGPIL